MFALQVQFVIFIVPIFCIHLHILNPHHQHHHHQPAHPHRQHHHHQPARLLLHPPGGSRLGLRFNPAVEVQADAADDEHGDEHDNDGDNDNDDHGDDYDQLMIIDSIIITISVI